MPDFGSTPAEGAESGAHDEGVAGNGGGRGGCWAEGGTGPRGRVSAFVQVPFSRWYLSPFGLRYDW